MVAPISQPDRLNKNQLLPRMRCGPSQGGTYPARLRYGFSCVWLAFLSVLRPVLSLCLCLESVVTRLVPLYRIVDPIDPSPLQTSVKVMGTTRHGAPA